MLSKNILKRRSLVIAFGALGATVACLAQIPSPPQFTSALPEDVQQRFPTIVVEPGTSALASSLQAFLVPAAGMHVMTGRGPQSFSATGLNPFPGTVINGHPGHALHPMHPIHPNHPGINPFPGTVVQPPVTGTLPNGFLSGGSNSGPAFLGPPIPAPGTVPNPSAFDGNHGHHFGELRNGNNGHHYGQLHHMPFPGTVINPGSGSVGPGPFPGTVINPDSGGVSPGPFPGTVINPGSGDVSPGPFPGTVINPGT